MVIFPPAVNIIFLFSQNQLSMTEKELDKKFRETGAYKNLRDMLAKKNKQIKDYRERLSK